MSGDRSPRILDVDIEELDIAGDGVAAAGRLRLSVPFTIPGERVRVSLTPARNGRVNAVPVAIVRASPHRVRPRCMHFGPDAVPGLGACGGCTWQHIAYPEQLRLKRALLDRLVRSAVPGAPQAVDMLAATPTGQPWGYRNKMHFVFGNLRFGGRRHDTTLVMGHYARGSRRVIPIRECPVHDERGNGLAFRARDTFAAAELKAAGVDGGVLRSLSIRAGCHTPEIMATLVVTADSDRRLRTATRRLLEHDPPTSAHLNVHERDDAFVFGERTRRLHGPERMREEVAGISLLTSPTAFFQTHVRAADILVRLVTAAIPSGSEVADLYAGGGLFAIPLAIAGHTVIAIEENRAAVVDGESALRLNPAARDRCRFIARRVETALGSLRRADAVVLDPPREGCSPAVLEDIGTRLRPSLAVYVSCNPASLADDLKTLCRSGYEIRSLQPVDMFPHTAHVETVAVLERQTSKTSPPPRRGHRRSPATPRAAAPTGRR